MMKPWGGPNFRKNSDRCKGDEYPCAYCGKPIKDKAKALWVEICCDQFVLLIEGEKVNHDRHGNYMGGYPLGPECARAFKKLLKKETVA